MSIVDENSSFYGVIYVRGEVFYFNVEELSAFLEIPTYSDAEGTLLKDDIDLDMFTVELTKGTKTKWPREGQLSSARLTLKYFSIYEISCSNWMCSTNLY